MHILTEHGWHTLVNYFIEKLGGEVKIEWDELKKQPAVILAHSNPDFILFTHPCFKEIKGNYKKGIILNFNGFLYRGKTAVNKDGSVGICKLWFDFFRSDSWCKCFIEKDIE